MVCVELGDASREEPSGLAPFARHEATEGGKPEARVDRPQRVGRRRRRYGELERRDAAAGPHHARKLAQRRTRIIDVAQQIGEREVVELAVAEREPLGLAADEGDEPFERRLAGELGASDREHLGALVQPHDGASVAAYERPRYQSRAGRHIQHAVASARVNGRDHRPPPARILPEAQHRADPFVVTWQPGKQLAGVTFSRANRYRCTIVHRGNILARARSARRSQRFGLTVMLTMLLVVMAAALSVARTVRA